VSEAQNPNRFKSRVLKRSKEVAMLLRFFRAGNTHNDRAVMQFAQVARASRQIEARRAASIMPVLRTSRMIYKS